MKTTKFKSAKGMSQNEFETKFKAGAFYYTQTYMQNIQDKKANLLEDVADLKESFEEAKDGNLPRQKVWRYIDLVGNVMELFDDLAMLTVNSQKQLDKLHENIVKDNESPARFYGRAQKKSYTRIERREIISKAIGVHGYSSKSWYRSLAKSERAFIKRVFRAQVNLFETACNAFDRIKKDFVDVHNSSKHTPGSIFIPDSTYISLQHQTWSVTVMKSLLGSKNRRKGVPISLEMLEVLCSSADTALKMIATVCEQNMTRISTFDECYLPVSLTGLSETEQVEYAKILTKLPKIELIHISGTLEATMKLPKNTFFREPKKVWNKYFEKIGVMLK